MLLFTLRPSALTEHTEVNTHDNFMDVWIDSREALEDRIEELEDQVDDLLDELDTRPPTRP